MNKLYQLICLSLICMSGYSQSDIKDGFVQLFHPSGQLSSEGTLVNGVPEGYWKTYHPSGFLKSEGNRVNFKLDSTWVFYNDSGVVASSVDYKNGLIHGWTKVYYGDGRTVRSAEHYSNGLQDSVGYYYYLNGALKESVPYVNGKREGILYEFAHDDGRIIGMTTYKNGFVRRRDKMNRYTRDGLKTGAWKVFYDDLTVRWEGRYTNDMRNGYFRYYDKKGNLERSEKYENDKLVIDADELTSIDIQKDYYPGAKIKQQRSYKDGKLHGATVGYNLDGSIDTTDIYKEGVLVASGKLDVNGIRQDYWEIYFDNGELKAKGNYKDGLRMGYWEFYFKGGQLEQKGTYLENEVPHGEWNWFYENGQLLRTEVFRYGKEDGLLIEYADSGAVITKGEFVDGEKEGLWFYEMGDHREEGNYQAGRREGPWNYYYPDNQLSFTGHFVDGFPDGEHEYFYSNGRPIEIGKFEMSRRVGDWRTYTEEGILVRTVTYKNGTEYKINGVKIKY